MNIFEALAKGDGKATFSSSLSGEYAYFNYKDLSFHWLRKNVTSKLSDLSIRSMYWIPYVPHERVVDKKCTNCKYKIPNDIVFINSKGRCIVCDNIPNFFPRVNYIIIDAK